MDVGCVVGRMTLLILTTLLPPPPDSGLNPILTLLPMFTGYPSFQLLIETLRNQIFAMPRPALRRTAQQQLTEREW